MHQPHRQQSFGFSNTAKSKTSKKKPVQASADHAEKEQLAVALINQGKLQEAEAIYKELISLSTSNHSIYGNLAALCGMQGRLDECIKYLHKVLDLKPNFPEALHNLGTALKEKGELDAAINAYSKAIELCPNDPDTHYNLGNVLEEKGDLNAAIASYNSSLQLKTNHPEAHYNLGNVLQEKGELKGAIASYKSALKLKPNFPEAHNNLGNALQMQGDLTGAIASYNSALTLKPNYPSAHNNLGNALQTQGDLTTAITSYESAIKLKPNYPSAHYNLSMAELLTSDCKSGWHRYEYRFQALKDQSIVNGNPSCRKWNGEALAKGNKLLLVTEQGLGDTLQFMRYATALSDQGISVSLCAPHKLHSLIQASGINHSPLTREQANQVTEGEWIPLLSVPRHLEISSENPIITDPYIKTTEELTGKWACILGVKENPVVGINWQGNPETEKTGLRGRSLALESFAPITSRNQMSLLSLQKGFGSEQLETCSFKDRFVSCQDQVNETWDFLETAAIVANCDLVITSDTSVAHLAGGMGKTTWLLLHKVPDWRWGLNGDSTFWYPSMRLFRQKERGNWNEVMERVAEALKEHFRSN